MQFGGKEHPLQPPGAVKERAPAISVIIPAKDEEAGIGRVIARVREVMESLGRAFEVIVVDDGSADATEQEALKAGAVVIRHPYNIGNGAAVKTGIRGARGSLMVMLDADGQHPPEDIPRLLEKMDSHHMAVGARTRDSDTSFHRSFANSVYNRFASYVCGRKIDDLTSGFRAVRGAIAPRTARKPEVRSSILRAHT